MKQQPFQVNTEKQNKQSREVRLRKEDIEEERRKMMRSVETRKKLGDKLKMGR